MAETKNDICSVNAVDTAKVENVAKRMPLHDDLVAISEIFKILGDPTRLNIVMALTQDELCVCDLAALIKVSVSAISHQLRLLRSMKLVKFRKQGKMVYYSLDDDHIENLIMQTREHINE